MLLIFEHSFQLFIKAMYLIRLVLCLYFLVGGCSLRLPMLMAQRHSAIVPDISQKSRLDVFVAKSFPAYTRSFIANLCDKGSITVNNKPQSKHYKVLVGDSVSFDVEDSKVSDITPEYIPIDVLHEDDSIIAVNKPVGMVVHPAVGSPNGTFANALLYHLGANASKLLLKEDLPRLPEGDADEDESSPVAAETEHLGASYLRPGIVHRLDKGTSGVLIAGKTPQAVASLSQLFAQRHVRKVYLAVCIGHPGDTTIARPIGRSPKNRQQMCVFEGPPGKLAVTHVRTLCFDGKLSVCLLRIETGRTHQIRVHLQDRRTPILGDDTYGNGDWNKRYRRMHQVKRHLLHAYETQLIHPFTHEKLTLQAPVPPDMSALVSKIAALSGARGALVSPKTGLLQCTTEVHGRGVDPGLFDPRHPTADLQTEMELLHEPVLFVPMERLVLEDQDPYSWQAEADPADLGYDTDLSYLPFKKDF